MKPVPRKLQALLGVVLAGASWSCAAAPEEATGSVAVEVAPLTLPGVTNVRYTITVKAGAETVWTRALDSAAYGSGDGDLSYVGTCDASLATNTVELSLDAIEVGAATLTPGVDYANPAPAGDPATLDVPCEADRDTAVTFDLTVARAATQGFFDVAVQFDDIFCSAKLDCQTDTPGGPAPLELLVNPHTGQRDLTAILALACTAGPDAPATHLHMSDLVATCDDGAVFSVMPDLGPGNLDPFFPGPPNVDSLFFQATVFRGVEPLAGANKAYWNVALGLNEAAFSTHHGCTLTATATATQDALVGGVTRAGATWPFVTWEVLLFDDDGATRCTEHGLGDGNGVAVDYSTTSGETFAVSFAAALTTVTRHADPVCGADVCDPNASCVGAVPSCVCDDGFTGDGETCTTSIAASCQDVIDRGEDVGSGIYQIDPDGTGGSAPFDVYCDMTTEDGGWTLIAYWRNAPTTRRSWGQVVVAGNAMAPYSENAGLYPVPPAGTINTFSQQLLRSSNGSWNSLYGAYVVFDTFETTDFPLGSAGFPATRANGTATTLYSQGPAWSTTTSSAQYFSIFTTNHNGGPCGGATQCGSNKLCPALHEPYACHWDFSPSYAKFLYGR